ncbi:MAG: 6-phosphofructokinase [Bacteroidetes bacterium]|nr:6-phosphofructokinase [Bacteroidota bacterium]
MKKIAVFTSGGDAPGMNACIRSVVRTGIYEGLEVEGIRRGYQGMIDNDFLPLERRSVANIIQLGGTILKTARCLDFMTPEGRQKAADNLRSRNIDGLVCIGGNGSYTGALKLYEEHGIPTIGLPGTIDNDLYGTDYTIGFDTAINTAVQAIDKIRDTADSHDRVFLVEVMGRDAGFIGISVGISGGAEGILIPEDTHDMEKIHRYFDRSDRRSKSFSIIVVAEGDQEGGVLVLSQKLSEKYPDLDIRATILGHIQRGGSPTANDRILASRLGYSAVHALIQGHKSQTLGIVNDKVKMTPFDEAIHKHKPINSSLIRMAEILSS